MVQGVSPPLGVCGGRN